METELSFWDKLKSWKRWMAILGAVLPILLQALTGAIGWPLAACLAGAALIAGIFGLSKEDAARLEAAGKVLATKLAEKAAAEEPAEAPKEE